MLLLTILARICLVLSVVVCGVIVVIAEETEDRVLPAIIAGGALVALFMV